MIQAIKNYAHLCLALIANIRYRFPAKELKVIGVTGTDGKTTTTSLLYHILKQNGYKTAMITSVGAYIGDTVYDIGFHVTTPSSFAIQQYLRKSVDMGYSHVVLEVTSHALDQNRPWGISFLLGILTNITNEHLDYHKTYEQYVAAKLKLLLYSITPIINKDDNSYDYVMPYLKDRPVVTYSLQNASAKYTLQKMNLTIHLIGDFNRSNVLAAASAARELGLSIQQIQKGLDSFTLPPGRQEILTNSPYMVMLDFAHTPNAFTRLLPEIKKQTKGKFIHVFGSAGERDAEKRPEMGRISAEFADIIVLTAEDPRSESVTSICSSIEQGIPTSHKRITEESLLPKSSKALITIENREKAIAWALSIARPGDSLLVTGKGHESSMNYGNGEIPWNEKEVIYSHLNISVKKRKK